MMMQRVSPESFADRGLHVDGSSIAASIVCLAVVLFFSVDRIAGPVIAGWLQRWKDERAAEQSKEIMDAREQLEKGWPGGDDSGPKP